MSCSTKECYAVLLCLINNFVVVVIDREEDSGKMAWQDMKYYTLLGISFWRTEIQMEMPGESLKAKKLWNNLCYGYKKFAFFVNVKN